MIDSATLSALVVARGGDPACLHCTLSTLLSLYFETRPEGKAHAADIAGALGEVIGDLLAPAPTASREACVVKIVELMRTRFESQKPAGETPPSRLN